MKYLVLLSGDDGEAGSSYILVSGDRGRAPGDTVFVDFEGRIVKKPMMVELKSLMIKGTISGILLE